MAEDAESAELRERLEVFGAFMGGIIFEFDDELRFRRVWTAQPGLLALPADALIGRTVTETVGAAYTQIMQEAIAQIDATGEPAKFDYTLDVPDGRRTFSAELRPHTRDAEKRTYTMLTRDVTEAKELEGKLLQAERLAALGLLAASVGHEIRQPLSYVLASLEVMDRELARLPLTDKAMTSVGNIRNGARRIAEIAASLDFLAGRRERTATSFDVRTPIQAAIDLCASELSNHVLERDIPQLPRIEGDEGELCQVFANLLLNAAQSFDGRAPQSKRRVRVFASRMDQKVRVVVQDNGTGIAPEHITRVFDPFFSTKDRGRGTGLGLFISRSIVEAQGGTLKIESEVGKGTTVEVQLPISNEEAPRQRLSSRPDMPDRRRLSLLVVDDEPSFLESLCLALEGEHDVETLGNSSEALRGIEANPNRWDIVICDLAMAEVDGIAFYERMKELGAERRFILMSAGAFTPRAADFIAKRPCPMIAKPFMLEELLGLLDRVARRL